MKRWISSHPARTGKLRREVRIHLRISSGIRSISWMATLIDPFVRAWWCWVDATTAARQPATLHRNVWIDHSPTFHLIKPDLNLRNFSRGFRDSPLRKPNETWGSQKIYWNCKLVITRTPWLSAQFNLMRSSTTSSSSGWRPTVSIRQGSQSMKDLNSVKKHRLLFFLQITILTPGHIPMYWIVQDTGPASPVAVSTHQTPTPQNRATNLLRKARRGKNWALASIVRLLKWGPENITVHLVGASHGLSSPDPERILFNNVMK